MSQYISYLRVSTKKQQRSGLGLEAQREIISHYAKVDGATIVKEVIEAESGKETDNRPRLNAAIEECNQHGYYLVVAKLDRLSRDVQDTFRILKELKGRLKSFDIPQIDSFTLAIFAGLAQRERELISIRTKAALKALQARGVKLGRKEGFTRIDQKAGTEAASKQAKEFRENPILVAMVEKCVRDGLSREKTALFLNQNGFKTARGCKYSESSVYRLIRSLKIK